jgi:hypothetical protein
MSFNRLEQAVQSGRARGGLRLTGDQSARQGIASAFTRQVALANLATSNPLDLWLFTPDGQTVDAASIVAEDAGPFAPVTVQFVEKTGSAVTALTSEQQFTGLTLQTPFKLAVPAKLSGLPVFLRFRGAATPAVARITLQLIYNNIQ